jgi:hypothetical protein
MRITNVIRNASFITALVAFTQLGLVQETYARGDQQSKNRESSSRGAEGISAQSKSMEVVVIEFEPGQSNLSEDERQKLSDAVQNLKEGQSISSTTVAGWSDKQSPRSGSLDKKHQDIAKKRISNIEKVLTSEGQGKVSQVQSFNMATMPSMQASRGEAEMRSAFGRRGAEMSKDKLQTLKKDGGPSKSVVILEIEESAQ